MFSQRNRSLKDKEHFVSKLKEDRTFQRKKKTEANAGLDEDNNLATSGNGSGDHSRGRDFFREVMSDKGLAEWL